VGSDKLSHLTRVTIVVAGSSSKLELVRKQLEKIVDVVRVSDITAEDKV